MLRCNVCTINEAKDARRRNILNCAMQEIAQRKRVCTNVLASARCFLELNPADGDTHRDS